MKIPVIQFIYDRKKVSGPNKKGTVEMRITYLRTRKFLSTGITIYSGQWDSVHECVINSSDAAYSNQILLDMRRKAMRIVTDMEEKGEIDINEIPVLMRQSKTGLTFPDYIYKRMKERRVTDETRKTYKAFFTRFVAFGGMETFADVNERNVRAFDEYLHNFRWKEKDRFDRTVECRYSKETIRHFHKKLKVFINDAIIDGYVRDDPYRTKRIKIERGETRIDQYLTKEELQRIIDYPMPTRSIAEARDLFVFQCLTGLAYSDLMSFDFSKARVDGEYEVYTSRRMKTGAEFTFVLIPKAMEILRRYDYHLPHLPNQKYNLKLKIIADAAGIDKNITSHMGRRTAGSIWLNEGIPIEVVSKCMGHRSITTTQKAYVKILDKTIVQAFAEHIYNKE